MPAPRLAHRTCFPFRDSMVLLEAYASSFAIVSAPDALLRGLVQLGMPCGRHRPRLPVDPAVRHETSLRTLPLS